MFMFFQAGVVREEHCWVEVDADFVKGSQISLAALMILSDRGTIYKNVSGYMPKALFVLQSDVETIRSVAHFMTPTELHDLVASYHHRVAPTAVDVDAGIQDAFNSEAFQSCLHNSLPRGM